MLFLCPFVSVSSFSPLFQHKSQGCCSVPFSILIEYKSDNPTRNVSVVDSEECIFCDFYHSLTKYTFICKGKHISHRADFLICVETFCIYSTDNKKHIWYVLTVYSRIFGTLGRLLVIPE